MSSEGKSIVVPQWDNNMADSFDLLLNLIRMACH